MPNTAVRAAAEGVPKVIFRTVAEFPELYIMVFSGNDFAPRIADGDSLVFSKSETPQRDDIVIAWERPDKMQPGDIQPGIFTLSLGQPGIMLPFDDHPQSEVKPVFVLMQGDGRRALVEASKLLAVHKCVNIVKRED
ncbi:hypothetical protein ABUE31_22760 [Mesorhizobium sp. ZMM04-5]|uniref:Uncharacterized protein n=2 Tax=Mesorhizobium marinum TaxID=3228790 RepID=A0ABV3R6N7_9HYPH